MNLPMLPTLVPVWGKSSKYKLLAYRSAGIGAFFELDTVRNNYILSDIVRRPWKD